MTTPFTHKIAYLPEQRPDVVTPQWLDWLVALGYTGLYLEFDPFAPVRSGNISQFPLLYRLISLYDLAWGPERQRLREWINHTRELAHARGLKVYLALWEPRIPAEAWGLFPTDWRGRGGWDREPWNTISWCLSHPPAAAAYEQMATEAFASVRGLDGLKIGSHDNDAHLCSDACPRCQGQTDSQKLGRVFQMLLRAADASGLHHATFDYVVYNWWMSDQAIAALAALLAGRRVTVLGRSTQDLPQFWEGQELGRVFDLALGLSGISDKFREQAQGARRRGWAVADMTVFGHAIEYFWLPYTPAPHRVAERIVALRAAGAAGWFDYDCGGVYPGINTEIIRQDSATPATDAGELVDRTLSGLFPAAERAAARAAYKLAEEALALRPIAFESPDVRLLSGRSTIESTIALPFEPGDITGLDQGHRVAFFAPTNFLTPHTVPTLHGMHAACAVAWERAWEKFVALRGQGPWAARGLPWEKQVVRAHVLCAGSAARYIQMAGHRLARGQGTLTAAQERDALRLLLTAELVAAEEFATLWRADRRLLMNPNIRLHPFLQACVPWVPIDRADPFLTKLAHTRAQLARLADGQPLDAVPGWET